VYVRLHHAIENTANQNTAKYCLLDGITSNLPIVRRVDVTVIVLATVFSMTWYKQGEWAYQENTSNKWDTP